MPSNDKPNKSSFFQPPPEEVHLTFIKEDIKNNEEKKEHVYNNPEKKLEEAEKKSSEIIKPSG